MLADGSDTWDKDAGNTKEINVNGGRLRLLVTATWDDGRRISEMEEAWDERGGFTQGFDYVSADPATLTVSPTGLITALGNGETVVTVTPKNEDPAYQALSAKITITTANQGTGLIVTKVQVVDEHNKPYGDDPIKFTELSKTTKLYARVTYKDKSEGNKKVVYSNAPEAPASEKPKAGDQYSTIEEAFSTVNWQAGDSQYVYVSNNKGVATIKALANSTTRIYVTVTGGDTLKNDGFGPGIVYGSVVVDINNGKTIDGQSPANELKVNIVYENDEKNVLKSKTYSVDEFEALGAVTRTYTLTRKGGKYVTDRAYGVPMATLLGDLGIATDDIAHFRLAANDGANPGRLSARYLLKTTRYYLPNYDIGGSWQGKEQVPTMIALKDSWNADTQVTGEMNSGTRFRLLFGSATSADSATDKSIKYINTLTIVMNGGAPVGNGKGDAGDGDDDKKKPKKGAAGIAAGGSGDEPGSGENGEGGGASQQKTTRTAPSVAEATGDDPDEPQAQVPDAEVDTAEDQEDTSTPWRIFEMMNKSSSDLVANYEDNPFLPFLAPAIGLIIIASSSTRYALFRRRLR